MCAFLALRNYFWFKGIIFVAFFFIATIKSWGQIADFTADVTAGCAPIQVTFTDISSGSPIAWEWDFGKENNNTSQLQNPSIVYTNPGVYRVTLTTTFAGGSSNTVTKTAYIRIFAIPELNFSTAITNSCLPSLKVDFINNSTPGEGTITRWEWVFGDGNTSNERSPTHIYTASGERSVTLRATNSVGCTAISAMPLSINIENITVDFNTSASCEMPTNISFTNLSTGGDGQESYIWNFGDGTTSTEASPQHSYSQAGNYTVSLSIEEKSNCMLSRELQVGELPSPSFTVDTQTRCSGSPITFESSDPGISNFEWEWGDGQRQSSTTGRLSHTYNAAGSYTVTLTATYAGGCTGGRTQQVEIRPSPNPDFSINGCESDRTFTFTRTPGSFISSWAWQFGDGAGSTLENPAHRYTSKNTFQVELRVVNNFGCTGRKVKNNPVFSKPKASFAPDQLWVCPAIPPPTDAPQTLGGCAPHTIQFQDNSDFGIPDTSGKTVWTFGEGGSTAQPNPSYTFTNPGDYNVTLTITNIIGCQDQITKVVKVTDVLPIPNFSLDKEQACVGEEVQFTNLSTNSNNWCWTLEIDSVITSKEPKYEFQTLGSQDITLTTHNFGCSASITIEDAILIVGVQPDFIVDFSNCRDPYQIKINNVSQGFTPDVDTWSWDFGGGATQDQSYNPSHRYDTTGKYIISLTMNDVATNCTVKSNDTIQIVDLKANFSGTPQNGCRNTAVQFSNESEFASLLFWDFGDGVLVEGKESEYSNPRKVYSQPGQYDVRLTAVDIHGCINIKDSSNFITIFNINGGLSFTPISSRCTELDVTFTDRSSGTPPITGWQWDFGDGATSTVQNPSHTYTTLGEHNVSLTVSNTEGQCGITVPAAINFTNPEPNFTISKEAYCLNELFSIANRSRNATTYRWEIEGQPVTTTFSPAVQYPITGNFDVSLTAIDALGCEQTSVEADAIQITDITVNFDADKVEAECPPLVTSFTATASAEVEQWMWDMGDGVITSIEEPTYVYTNPGTYDVSLSVISSYGCRSEIIKESFIQVNGPSGTFVVKPERGCVDEPISFESNTTNATKHIWNFGDGGSATTKNATYSYKSAKTYSPILQLEDTSGCVIFVRAPNDIVISPLPEVDFTFFEPYPFPREKVTFVAKGDENLQWEWEIEGQNQYDKSQVIHAFSTHGLLSVHLKGINQLGCAGISNKEIYVQEDIRFMPNVFTPNGDDKNNTFKILDVQNGAWDLTVYNRYGNTVYEMQDYDNSWHGNGLSPGVYYYQLKNRHRPKSYKGYIQILQ